MPLPLFLTFFSLFLPFGFPFTPLNHGIAPLSSFTSLNGTFHQNSGGRVGPCASNCKFRLCGFNGRRTPLGPPSAFSVLNAPGRASFPLICRSGVSMGRVLESGEAQVATGTGSFANISQWKPRGLRASFPPRFIGTAQIPYYPWSGVTRTPTRKVFRAFLHDRCIKLPVRKWEVLNAKTRLVARVREGNGVNDCVSFRTTNPMLYVELIWDSADDLDLSLIEPSGKLLDFKTPNLRTEFGKLDIDALTTCAPRGGTGRERIIYFPNQGIEKGTYVVRVIHFRNCKPAKNTPTTWRLTVVKDGVLSDTKFGISDKGNKEFLHIGSFDFP